MGKVVVLRRLTLGLAMLGWGSTAARADQIGSPLADARWTGFYVGAQLGGAWTQLDWRYVNANYFNTLGPAVAGTQFDHDPSGVVGGSVGGYNYQMGPWVLGVEVSVSAADLSQELPSPIFPALDVTANRMSWLATAAGRLGYAWDRWLIFAKGGWAGADVELTLFDVSASVRGSKSQWANGWVVGAGAEYMLSSCLSIGFAYDHAGLSVDNETVACPGCAGAPAAGFGVPVVDGDIRVQSVMGRLTFHQ
jgi:outer membrane immunogenic protein